jgi:S1-C subfamily serine protease
MRGFMISLIIGFSFHSWSMDLPDSAERVSYSLIVIANMMGKDYTLPSGESFSVLGTGFVISDNGLILTAHHCITNPTPTIMYKGILYPCTVLQNGIQAGPNEKKVYDLAIIKSDQPIPKRTALILSRRETFRNGEPVAAYGIMGAGDVYSYGGQKRLDAMLTNGIIIHGVINVCA